MKINPFKKQQPKKHTKRNIVLVTSVALGALVIKKIVGGTNPR